MAFKVFQEVPKRLKKAPGGTQEASKRLPRGSKSLPGGLKDGSKRPVTLSHSVLESKSSKSSSEDQNFEELNLG